MPRPLGSTGVTPLPRYYGPLRLPRLQRVPYGFRHTPCLAWRETGGRGLSSSWWFLLRARSPLTPESPTGASGRSLRIDAGFTSSGRLGHPQLRLTRPNRVRASLRLAHLPPPAPIGRACSRPSRVRLRGSRPFTMTNTFSSLEPSTLLGAPEGNERNKGCN
jgi:hypothetical protein